MPRPGAFRWLAAAVVALAAALASPANATQEGWPALFDVAGVAPNDRLNIRAAPSASAARIGSLAPDATGVEVIRPDDRLRWGLVNTGEGTGWVSLAYLARRAGQWDGALPRIARCFGTEPFWSIQLEWEGERDGALSFKALDEPERQFGVLRVTGSQNSRNRHALVSSGEAGTLTLLVRGAMCSDGMSDRAYGLEVDALLEDGEGLRMLSGCCSLSLP